MKQYTTSCFKNVPLSVSIRHQQSLCYLHVLAVRPGTFLYPGDEVLGGTCVIFFLHSWVTFNDYLYIQGHHA